MFVQWSLLIWDSFVYQNHVGVIRVDSADWVIALQLKPYGLSNWSLLVEPPELVLMFRQNHVRDIRVCEQEPQSGTHASIGVF